MGVIWEILLSGFLLPSTADSFGAIRSSGPYTILGSTLYLFHRYTPRLHPRIVSILGFELSEKVRIRIESCVWVFSSKHTTLVDITESYHHMKGFFLFVSTIP